MGVRILEFGETKSVGDAWEEGFANGVSWEGCTGSGIQRESERNPS